jgi:hypothetical protein
MPPLSSFFRKTTVELALREKEMDAPLVETTQSGMVRNYITLYQVKNCDEFIETT